MGGGESTNSSQSVSKPLTAEERQDLYRSSIGNILNTYIQSGLPYGGQGSMTPKATNAAFDPYAKTVSFPVGDQSGLYNASGRSSTYDNGGKVTWNPKTYFQADDPTVNMPTGAKDPGGINLPVYQTPTYQEPGAYRRLSNGDYSILQDSIMKGNTAGLDKAKADDVRKINDDATKRGIWSSGLVAQREDDLSGEYAPAYAKAGTDATVARYGMEQQDNQGANVYSLTAADKANNFNVTNANNSYQAGWQPLEYLRNLWNGTSGQTSGSTSFGQSLNFSV